MIAVDPVESGAPPVGTSTAVQTRLSSAEPTLGRTVHRRIALAALVDTIVVSAFVAVGRSSHEEGITVAGMASTLWPFLVGAVVGWGAGRVWQRPTSLVPGALSVWAGSVAVGMALRVVAGQGTALSFVIVATVFLGACFFGWRLIAWGIASVRPRRTGCSTGKRSSARQRRSVRGR